MKATTTTTITTTTITTLPYCTQQRITVKINFSFELLPSDPENKHSYWLYNFVVSSK